MRNSLSFIYKIKNFEFVTSNVFSPEPSINLSIQKTKLIFQFIFRNVIPLRCVLPSLYGESAFVSVYE